MRPNITHPFLHFSAGDVPSLLERVQRPPFDQVWQHLRQEADLALDAPIPDGHLDATHGRGHGIRRSRAALSIAEPTGFVYALTGEERYARRAIAEALALADEPKWHTDYAWNRGADLATAEACLCAALVYDWCRAAMGAEEQQRVRDAVLEKGVGVYLQSVEEFHDWWADNPVSNWCGVVHGGCGLAALAFHDESDAARRAFETAWDNARAFLDHVHLADGGGHEGVMYHHYGVTYAIYLAVAAARFTGDDRGLYDEMSERLAGYWPVYMRGPDGSFANFGDINEALPGRRHNLTRWSGALTALEESKAPGGDDLLLWAADSVHKHGRDAVFYTLWRREAPPEETEPPLDAAALFRGAGHAVFAEPDLWLAYSGGWTSDASHCNHDLGSFVLVADGERLVNDPGYGAVETADHSSVLVDGEGQPRGAQARYLRFGSAEGYHYLASDLSACYEDRLQRFVRHVLMVGGRYVVILDELQAAEPAEFRWQLVSRHQTSADADTRTALVTGERMALHVVSAAPENAVIEARSIQMSTRQQKEPFHVTGMTPAEKTASTTFVTVLWPTPLGGEAPAVEWSAEGRLSVAGDGRCDTIRFRRAERAWELDAVNDVPASGIGDGSERTLTAFRPARSAR